MSKVPIIVSCKYLMVWQKNCKKRKNIKTSLLAGFLYFSLLTRFSFFFILKLYYPKWSFTASKPAGLPLPTGRQGPKRSVGGCRIVVIPQLSKLMRRVRFPSPAPRLDFSKLKLFYSLNFSAVTIGHFISIVRYCIIQNTIFIGVKNNNMYL